MRQILVISGKDNFDPINNQPAMDSSVLVDKLTNRDDIRLLTVGNGCIDISIQEIESLLSLIDTTQPLTVIVQCHGTMKDGQFKFIFGKDTKISSEELFNMISKYMGNNPIDLFTPACYGGGIMRDANLLPKILFW